MQEAKNRLEELVKQYPNETALSLILLKAPNDLNIPFPPPPTCDYAFSITGKGESSSIEMYILDQVGVVKSFSQQVTELIKQHQQKEQSSKNKQIAIQQLNDLTIKLTALLIELP